MGIWRDHADWLLQAGVVNNAQVVIVVWRPNYSGAKSFPENLPCQMYKMRYLH